MARLGRGQPNRPIISRAPAPAAVPVTFTVAFGLSVTATKHATASVAFAVAFDLSVTTTKSTGLNLPRKRRPWQFVAGPASGGHQLSLTKAKNRRYVAKLTESSELSFALDGRHSQAAVLDELSTDVHVLWTDDAGTTHELDRLRTGASGDELDETSHGTTFAGLDYRAVLSRRLLYSDATLTYTATDQAEIAWALVNYTQNLPGGALGISKGWTGSSPTGITRDQTFEVRSWVGENITQLSEMTDGFDWDVTPAGASALTLEVWHPQRGTNRGVVLLYGGLITKVSRRVDPAAYANAIAMTGADGLTVQELAAADIASRPEGRWDAQIGDTNIASQMALNALAQARLLHSQVITPTYTVRLRRGAWEGPDHIWIGDTVRLVIPSGRLRVDTLIRVYEVAITPGDHGDEAIELTLGGPRIDYRRRPREIERRLTTLERR